MELILSVSLFLGLPLLMLLAFKSNVGIMFLAALSGLVLLSNLDDIVVNTAGAIFPGEGAALVRLTVVLLSMVFAGLVFRETTVGPAVILNGLIAVILAVTLWLTLPAATGVSWLVRNSQQQYWLDAYDYRALIIASGFALSLVAVLISRRYKSRRR